MGYSEHHVAQIRQRIIDAANTLFRKQGYHPTSINQIMNKAGLTHGGFYAHFDSKEDLFCVAMEQDLNFTKVVRRQSKSTNQEQKQARISLAIQHYLDKDNVQKMGDACTAVALSAEVHRIGGKAKTGFTRSFKDLLTEFEMAIGDRQSAIKALVLSIGALTVARALSDDALVEELLNTCASSNGV